ncbi:MAG: thiamine phosphate synthase [Gemmatimonadota bacterium]
MIAADLSRALRLIVITDRALSAPRSIEQVVEGALAGGARAIQLRDKHATARELLQSAVRLRQLTRAAGALLFVNDRFDVALAAGADGVHLGPHDLPVAEVRAVVPPAFLIGYSTDEVDSALRAVEDGADYIGCGAVFPTTGKADVGEVIGVEGLRRVVEAVPVPVVGIGGISVENVADVRATGAAGVAVIGAVVRDPEGAARKLIG